MLSGGPVVSCGVAVGAADFLRLARRDVNDALTIATRGEMRLYECDCHLEYARLHLAQGEKDEARTHFELAEKMVDEMGYHRRDAEVLLIKARLELLEGNRKRARQTLASAKKRIDEMGCHRWDIDAAELEREL